MIGVLWQGAQEVDIHNLTVIQSAWEEAQVEPSDVVLCANVLYGVEDVDPFVRNLNSHATGRVLILMYMDSPQSHHSPFWQRVHGEERITLPALRELVGVLWEMGIHPDIEMLEQRSPYVYETREDALEELRQRLYVNPGTEKDRRLEKAMDALLDRTPNGFVIRGAPPRRLGLLSWGPA